MSDLKVQKGDVVAFTGFTSEDTPDNSEFLEEGQEYTVESINEGEGENDSSVNLIVPNPDFNSKKRASKANPKTFLVDVFPDEFSLSDEGEEGADDATTTDAENTVEFTEVKKGDVVTVLDEEGESLTGEVFKKTKTLLGIVVVEDDGAEDEVVYKSSEIETIYAAEEEPESESEKEEKTAPKKKAAAKKKTAAKKKAPTTKAKAEMKPKATTKKKAATKKKAPAKADKVDPEDEDLKGIIILEEGEEDETVLTMVDEADDLCELAEELAEEAAVQDYRLGGILYHVRISKAFREVLEGLYDVKGGFQEYVETELGIGYRKAMYLIDIYTKWNKYGLDADKVADIGWTKAQEIARVMEEGNAAELVELATDSTVAELKETIKESYSKKGSDTREVVKKVTFKFRLTEDQGAAVEGYMEQAAEQLGLTKMEEVFEHVVSEWAQEHLDISSTKSKSKPKTSSRRKK